MGVSGCGKSTVASALAEKLSYQYVEADDFHPSINREHMRNGQPLTDDMREPWIDAIHQHLTKLAGQNTSCVLSFSGLKAAHRRRIKSVPMSVTTIYLEGDKELIASRMQKRAGHFMPTSLLASQFQAMEDPSEEGSTFSIDIGCSVQELIARALDLLATLRELESLSKTAEPSTPPYLH